MKTNWINECHVEGYVFSHSLKERVCGKNSLSQVISWFNSPEYSNLYTLKGTELVLTKKPPKLTVL